MKSESDGERESGRGNAKRIPLGEMGEIIGN